MVLQRKTRIEQALFLLQIDYCPIEVLKHPFCPDLKQSHAFWQAFLNARNMIPPLGDFQLSGPTGFGSAVAVEASPPIGFNQDQALTAQWISYDFRNAQHLHRADMFFYANEILVMMAPLQLISTCKIFIFPEESRGSISQTLGTALARLPLSSLDLADEVIANMVNAEGRLCDPCRHREVALGFARGGGAFHQCFQEWLADEEVRSLFTENNTPRWKLPPPVVNPQMVTDKQYRLKAANTIPCSWPNKKNCFRLRKP
jgi:hypothetical protein